MTCVCSVCSLSPASADARLSSPMNFVHSECCSVWITESAFGRCCTPDLSDLGSGEVAKQLLQPWSCADHPVCFSFPMQALWLPSKNRSLLPGSLHLLSHWLCCSGYERRRCHWSVSITGSSMGIQIWGSTWTSGKVMFLILCCSKATAANSPELNSRCQEQEL